MSYCQTMERQDKPRRVTLLLPLPSTNNRNQQPNAALDVSHSPSQPLFSKGDTPEASHSAQRGHFLCSPSQEAIHITPRCTAQTTPSIERPPQHSRGAAGSCHKRRRLSICDASSIDLPFFSFSLWSLRFATHVSDVLPLKSVEETNCATRQCQ